jgi:hypothetical protein
MRSTMKIFPVVLMVLAASCGSYDPMESLQPVDVGGARSHVLVELFTSEGCSSCPPADLLLMRIAKVDGRAITLEFHVDYWDSSEWKDKFSSPLFSQRQAIYGTKFKIDNIFTPQMVVDGSEQFVGSDATRLTESIADLSKKAKATLDLKKLAGGKLAVSLDNLPGNESSTIYLAIAEDGISTKVTGGENSGSGLAHSSVVRSLTAIGSIDKGLHKAAVLADVPSVEDADLSQIRYVVFVQEESSRRIVAVEQIAASE